VLYCCLSCADDGNAQKARRMRESCRALFEGITPYLPLLIEGSDMNGTPVEINVGRYRRRPR